MGQAGTGIAEIIGPANNVTHVSIIGGMAKGDMNNSFKHLIDMAHVMEAVLPGWPEGKKWIVDSIPKVVDGQAQSVTREGGIRVAMKNIGMGMLALSFDVE